MSTQQAEMWEERADGDDLTLSGVTGGEIGVAVLPSGAVRFTDYDSGWERWAIGGDEARRLRDWLTQELGLGEKVQARLAKAEAPPF